MSHLIFPIANFYSESIYRIAEAEAAAAARAAGSWGSTKSATVVADILTLDGSGYYEVNGANASNNVDTISGLSGGDEVILSLANVANAIVFRHGTGNLVFPSGVNITLDAMVEKVRLISNGVSITESSSRP